MRPGVSTLRDLALFAAFDDALLARLNDLADLARVGPGEVLFDEGQPPDQLFILQAGCVTTSRRASQGGEILTDVVTPVRLLAFATVLLGMPAETAAKTVTSSRLIIVPAMELRSIIAEQPRLGLAFLDYALVEARALASERAQLKTRSSAQRLAEYLADLVEDPRQSPARFILPYEKRFLAGKIGCSQENLSRAFAALRQHGVQSHQGVVVVRDVMALRRFAGLANQERQQAPASAGDGTPPRPALDCQPRLAGTA